MGWVDWRKSGSEDIYWGIDYAMLPNREWNQKQKHKKQPWSKVEYFAFGRGTVCFASLETSSHAANHTIPPPPSYEGLPLCPKDKNRSPFHGEKPLMIKRILGRRSYQIFQTILHGRDAILRVRDKLLISNMILQLWADVKYHVPTGFFVVKRRAVFILLASPKGCFLCFCFSPQYFSTEPGLCRPLKKHPIKSRN